MTKAEQTGKKNINEVSGLGTTPQSSEKGEPEESQPRSAYLEQKSLVLNWEKHFHGHSDELLEAEDGPACEREIGRVLPPGTLES